MSEGRKATGDKTARPLGRDTDWLDDVHDHDHAEVRGQSPDTIDGMYYAVYMYLQCSSMHHRCTPGT